MKCRWCWNNVMLILTQYNGSCQLGQNLQGFLIELKIYSGRVHSIQISDIVSFLLNCQIIVNGYFSFCLTSYNLEFLKNRTKFFSREPSFCQLSNMASSGLKKMLILIILYIPESVSVNMCPVNFSFRHIMWWFLMADVMPYFYRQMLCLGWCYCHLCCGRCYAIFYRLMLCLGWCYCHSCCGRWVNHRGRCYCLYFIKVADVVAILFCLWQVVGHLGCMLQHLKMADVIA